MKSRVSLKYLVNDCSSDVNGNSRSKDGADVVNEKYKDHPINKMINENVSLELRISFKEIRALDIQKEVSNPNSKKEETFGNISTKVLEDSSDIRNSILQDTWNYEIVGKQYFSQI